ncbi:MAG TPA: dual specificity protein phosphatase family protein [Microthrixaceae bacterium]|nr:dual specificity protein phosphatase family protein [Microthrixaceae bacterium]
MGTDDVAGNVEHHVLNLLDTTPEENPNLVLLIADAVDTIAEMVSDRRRVFVHCVAAENRTPTLAAAWLCRHDGLIVDEALTVVARELNEPKPFLREAVRSL